MYRVSQIYFYFFRNNFEKGEITLKNGVFLQNKCQKSAKSLEKKYFLQSFAMFEG